MLRSPGGVLDSGSPLPTQKLPGLARQPAFPTSAAAAPAAAPPPPPSPPSFVAAAPPRAVFVVPKRVPPTPPRDDPYLLYLVRRIPTLPTDCQRPLLSGHICPSGRLSPLIAAHVIIACPQRRRTSSSRPSCTRDRNSAAFTRAASIPNRLVLILDIPNRRQRRTTGRMPFSVEM